MPATSTSILQKLSAEDRQEILTAGFLKRVKKGQPHECWEWEGGTYINGYGQLKRERHGEHYAHRWAYGRWNGPIPEGKMIRHKCDNRRCVNPAHLEIGVALDNVHDMIERNPNAAATKNRKLQEADLTAIAERMKTKMLKNIAKDYGVTWKTISKRLENAGLRPEYNQKKLTPQQVTYIRDAVTAQQKTQSQLATEFNVSPSVISKVCNGQY